MAHPLTENHSTQIPFGIPDETWGEAVHAVVVCKPGTNVSSDELISHVRTQIASYKTPRSIEFRAEALPKSGAGKIEGGEFPPALTLAKPTKDEHIHFFF